MQLLCARSSTLESCFGRDAAMLCVQQGLELFACPLIVRFRQHLYYSRDKQIMRI